ncbi:MAG: carbohydrate ABC transporter permease [Acholeplasma sp.]|nr:carbohydrate ABC transporter permease [Acholeplasma sp.]
MINMIEKIKNYFHKTKDTLTSHKVKKVVLGSSQKRGIGGQVVIYILLIGISYVFLFPLFKIIATSFMSLNDILDPEVTWISKKLSFENFAVANRVLGLFPTSLSNLGNLYKTIRNILILAVIQTGIAALTGFAFARYNFKFKNFWFSMVLLSFVIPLPMITMTRLDIISSLQTLTGIKMFNTLFPQILFALLGQGINSAILVLIFYNFFKMIPKSLDEAARIDGATSIQTFYHVYVKLVIPIVVVVFLFSFIWNWNDSYTSIVFYSTDNPLVISKLSLFDSEFASLQEQQSRLNEGYKSAATFLTILPLLIIYIFAQKRFIEGIERTGLTGE